MSTGRTTKGRFSRGVSGNPAGRPSVSRRIVRELVEPDLLALGATPEEIDALIAVGSDKAKAVAAVVALSAAVVELMENPYSVRRTRFNRI